MGLSCLGFAKTGPSSPFVHLAHSMTHYDLLSFRAPPDALTEGVAPVKLHVQILKTITFFILLEVDYFVFYFFID